MAAFPANYWAMLAAAAVKFVLGALWCSPLLFGKAWMRLAGIGEAEMKANLPKGMLVDLVGSSVMAFVLQHAAHSAGAQGIAQGVLLGFFAWRGFIGLTTLSANLYENPPIVLFFLKNGYLLVALLLMGVIVTLWT